MGFNSEQAHTTSKPWLVFDCETCPMPDCGDYLTDPIEAPANYKDPAKIAAYIADKRKAQIEQAALDLDLCEIVAVAFQMECGTRPAVYTRADADERGLIEAFWFAATQFDADRRRDLVGFNILHFDLPILLRRSLYLGVPVPRLSLDKYRHDGIVDVADVLTYGGKTKWRSLAFYAKRFGIPHDSSIDGAQIPKLVADGKWADIAAHVRADVTTTVALAQRIGVLALSPAESAVA